VNFPDSDRCQILHGAATWCLLLPRTVKSSVSMLYGLFRIDSHARSYVGAIDVAFVFVESQLVGLGALSDFARCCLMVSILFPSTIINCTPTPWAAFAPLFLGRHIEGQGLAT